MKYKIKEICGGSIISLKLDKEINLKEVLKFFEGFEIVFESKDSLKVKKGNKEALIFSNGEIIFTNFDKNEIIEIAKKI